MKMHLKLIVVYVTFIFSQQVVSATDKIKPLKLPLNTVLQIVNDSAKIKNIDLQIQAQDLKQKQVFITYSPQVYLAADSNWDKKPSWSISTDGTQRTTKTTLVGFEKKSLLGISQKINYAFENTVIDEATALTQSTFNRQSLNYEINVSLLNNFNGQLYKLTDSLKQQQIQIDHLALKYEKKKLISDIKQSYWSLKGLNEILIEQNRILKLTDDLLRWTEKRHSMRLSEDVDVKQIQAINEVRKLDFIKLKNEWAQAVSKFKNNLFIDDEKLNSNLSAEYANLDFSDWKDDLVVFDAWPTVSQKMQSKKVSFYREDIEIENIKSKLELQQAELTKKSADSSLDFVGKYSTNAANVNSDSLWTQNTQVKYPSYYLGIKWTWLVDFEMQSESKQLVQALTTAHQKTAALKQRDLETEWTVLAKQIENNIYKKKMLDFIIEINQRKLDLEKQRLQAGRTTTFQMISFTQELLATKQDVIRNEIELQNSNEQIQLIETQDL